MTHPLLEQLAHQRQDEMAARGRAHRPSWSDAPELRPHHATTRNPRRLARLAALVSRA
jgi:hypothetical protein